MNWNTYQHYPHKIDQEAADSFTAFVIDGPYLYHVTFARESGEGTILTKYYFDDKNLPAPLSRWVDGFWSGLVAATKTVCLKSDQWASSFETYLDGKLYRWDDDRKEGSYLLWRVTLAPNTPKP